MPITLVQHGGPLPLAIGGGADARRGGSGSATGCRAHAGRGTRRLWGDRRGAGGMGLRGCRQSDVAAPPRAEECAAGAREFRTLIGAREAYARASPPPARAKRRRPQPSRELRTHPTPKRASTAGCCSHPPPSPAHFNGPVWKPRPPTQSHHQQYLAASRRGGWRTETRFGEHASSPLRPRMRLGERFAGTGRSPSRVSDRCTRRARSPSRVFGRCGRGARSPSRFSGRCTRRLSSPTRVFDRRTAPTPHRAAAAPAGRMPPSGVPGPSGRNTRGARSPNRASGRRSRVAASAPAPRRPHTR